MIEGIDYKLLFPGDDPKSMAAGFDPGTESEGIDRTFTLPWGQDALIEAMASANSHTVVTLTGGGAQALRALRLDIINAVGARDDAFQWGGDEAADEIGIGADIGGAVFDDCGERCDVGVIHYTIS